VRLKGSFEGIGTQIGKEIEPFISFSENTTNSAAYAIENGGTRVVARMHICGLPRLTFILILQKSSIA